MNENPKVPLRHEAQMQQKNLFLQLHEMSIFGLPTLMRFGLNTKSLNFEIWNYEFVENIIHGEVCYLGYVGLPVLDS